MQHHELFKTHDDSRTFFEMLKLGTTDLQRKVEALLPVTRNDLTFANYRHFLIRLLGFYIPVEEHIADFLSRGRDSFETTKRNKVSLLISDLRALGVPLEEIDKVPVCGAIKEINSMADLIGVLYALESLTLNSRQVLNHLKAHLQLNEQQIKFYVGYGDQTNRMWSLLRQTAENTLSDPEEKEIAVTRARNTLIKLKNWMKMSEVQA